MFPSDYLIFIQIILFLFITPGLPRVVIVSHTLNYGLKRSVWTAIGDISANLIQGILIVFIIGSFLSDNPQILYYLKWAGIFYIVYLAYDTYTAKIRSINSKEYKAKSIFSSFSDYESNIISQFSILMTTYVVLDFTTLMIYGLAAEKASIWLKDKPKTLNTISACVLVTIAIYIAATQSY